MNLLYVYIDQYYGVKDVEVCFDDRYNIHYDKVSDELSIQKNEKHIENFWGGKINSLSAIVGANGSGKSTIRSFITDMMTSSKSLSRVDVGNNIVVIEGKNGSIVYTKRKLTTPFRVESGYLPTMNVFFYSAHFKFPLIGSFSESNVIPNIYNATDGHYLMTGYGDYYDNNIENFTRIYKEYNNTIVNNVIGAYMQNLNRIGNLLIRHYKDMANMGLRPPRYMILKPDTSGHELFRALRDTGVIKEFPISNIINTKCRAQAMFVYNIFVNIATNRGNEVNEDGLKLLNIWLSIINSTTPDSGEELRKTVVETFSKFNDNLKHYPAERYSKISYDDILRLTIGLLNILNTECEFVETPRDVRRDGIFFIDFEGKDSFVNSKRIVNIMNFFAEILDSNTYLTARYLTLNFSHNIAYQTDFSSGEQEMLDMYSRIYDALTKFRSTNQMLLILDEAEIGYHPEWQRRFINNIVHFLNSMNVPDGFFQIIVTSHSPLILSDIPLSCTNYLFPDNVSEKTKPSQETFGANIFDLYRNSFFLKEGMIGEFAMEKIEKVFNLVENDNTTKVSHEEIMEARRITRIIADERIRNYLDTELEKLAILNPEEEIAYHQRKIDELKKRSHNEHN